VTMSGARFGMLAKKSRLLLTRKISSQRPPLRNVVVKVENKSGTGSFVFNICFASIFLFYTASRMESDAEFEDFVYSYVPFSCDHVLFPLRDKMKGVGLIKSRAVGGGESNTNITSRYNSSNSRSSRSRKISENGETSHLADGSGSGIGNDDSSDGLSEPEPEIEPKPLLESHTAPLLPSSSSDSNSNSNIEPDANTYTASIEVTKDAGDGKVHKSDIEQKDSVSTSIQTTTDDVGDISDTNDSHNNFILASENDTTLLSQTLRELIRQSATKGVRDTMLEELNGLSKEQLVMRIHALNAQFIASSEAEIQSVREQLRKREAELEVTYMSLLEQQRLELQTAAKAAFAAKQQRVAQQSSEALMRLQGDMENDKANALREQYFNFEKNRKKQQEEEVETIESDFAKEKEVIIEKERKLSNDRVEQLLRRAEATEATMGETLAAIEAELDRERSAATARTAIRNVWFLERALQTGETPPPNMARVFTAAGRGNDLAGTILKFMPEAAYTGDVSSVDDLRVRFRVVRAEAMRAALVPEWEYVPTILRQVAGEAKAWLFFNPAARFPMTKPSGGSADDILARISYHLDRAEMNEALNTTQLLKGTPRKLVKDFEDDLMAHVTAVLATRALKTKFELINVSYCL